MIQVIDILLVLAGTYIIVGILFSIYFYAAGAARLDSGVKEAPWHFKVIIFPGVVLFWSVLLLQVFKKS